MQCPRCQHDNPAHAKFCLECGTSLGRSGQSAASSPGAGPDTRHQTPDTHSQGERRQLTVMFCDLVGSTDLSQRLDAEDLRTVVRAYQEAAAAAVERHAGHIAQYLGDGLLVYFGYPQAHEDDAERAVRAGLETLTALGQVNDTLESLHGIRLAARVGIHTGAVVIGEMGGTGKSEVLALGDTTNIAARVQGAADPDTLVMSANTQRLVPGMFVVEERGPQILKGVRDPLVLYRVVEPSGVRSRLSVGAGRLIKFVGREAELRTVINRWARVRDGEGQTVLLLGEAGVGKSRLVYEMREYLAIEPHAWLECAAAPYTQGTPFHPVIALVARRLAFTAKDGVAEKLSKLETGLRAFASQENVALLADFLGLPLAKPLAMSPDLQRRKTIDLLTRWTLTLSTTQPLLLAVEDLHWCDASTLELLGHMIAQNPPRVLVLATARPEFSPPRSAHSNLTTVQLTRLTRPEARAMVELLSGDALPDEMVETLVARADGIPLYVEELTKAVVEPGVARSIEAIPPTLADSLMARLDRLSAAKEVAQRAAVLGREFSYTLLLALGGMTEAALRHGLTRLVDANIVYVRGQPPDATYTFNHALVQEAAYGSLLKRTRQQLHADVVGILLERFPERAAAEPEVVARHAELAGRIDDAITYHGLAGERALARSAHEEAIGQFRRAIALLDTWATEVERHARELPLQITLGTSLIAVRGYSHAETETAFARAAELAVQANAATELGVARIGLAILYANRAELERGRTLLTDVLAAAEARGDQHQAMMCYANLAPMEHYQGKPASSLACCERAIALYEPAQYVGKPRVLGAEEGVVALGVAGWDLWQLGYPDAALARAQAAVALARRLERPFPLAFALFFEVVVHWNRDRGGAALQERVAEVIALSQAQGFRLWRGIGGVFQAAVRVMDADTDRIAEIMENLALAGETGNQAGAPALMLVLAEAQRAAGQLDTARGTVAAALAFSAQTGQPFWDADLHRLDGDLLLATGCAADEAVTCYHRALAIAREQGARSLELRAAMSFARLWRNQAKRSAARHLLGPVYGWFTEGFDTPDLVDAKTLLDEL